MTNNIGTKAADNMRILSAAMVEKAKSGHPGGAMGGADFVHTLYTEFLNFDPTDMAWPNRDRFFPGSRTHVANAIFHPRNCRHYFPG
jgi:transketolase